MASLKVPTSSIENFNSRESRVPILLMEKNDSNQMNIYCTTNLLIPA
jgi:hypothetical protein